MCAHGFARTAKFYTGLMVPLRRGTASGFAAPQEACTGLATTPCDGGRVAFARGTINNVYY
ncbi:hypothetical protein DWUX_1014 [Desulfovibrio diazotrophicus]|nr:hypothetical protein DWUX_1014 [Desulfovibrio diazotrophicus]